ncbi:hypothetical protein LTR78_007020 [Recurvomyces mirabilis]|uniref:Uncharacterized protein n=1 Tax=Recurvomyces mirabilis TaxID=574656 RepID=A0AAE0WK33_9PEZI|nr:hypothetical protein LTR78_007020 [Recurvomyces mirabilis]KAK5153404.1 hypothetical protein LTS14_007573 [Recurvomyces mirabilis]
MRRSIDRHPERIKSVLTDNELRKSFLKGVSKDEKKVVRAFFASNSDNALKTKPKGYEADHPEIELLRLRNYTLGTKMKQADLLGEQGLEHVAKLLATLKPMITFLNSVVMPDEEESEEDEQASDESEQDDVDA